MTNHIMLDLETLGTGSHAAILSIGAVAFDPWGKEVNYSFHLGITFESAFKFGRAEGGTLEWWFGEDRDAARRALMELPQEDLDNVLFGFTEWVRLRSDGGYPAGVWGNGAGFDNVILRNAYSAVGYEAPWPYKADRCFRTLKNLAPQVKSPKIEGIAHDALDDARMQAMWLQKIVKKLKLEVL